RRGVAGRHPGGPHLVHLGPRSDVGEPDVGFEQLALVGPAFREIAVDHREDFARLLGDAFAAGFVRGQAGEIDRIAVHHRLAHEGPGIVTLDGHTRTPLLWGVVVAAGAHASAR